MTKKTPIVFTTEDINKFLFGQDTPNDRYWLSRKAYVIVAFFGGLRCAEIHAIDITDLETDNSGGIYINYQRGDLRNKFLG